MRKNQQNLTGWSGILFFCASNDDSAQAVKAICEKTYTNAEFLAATGKINLIKAQNGYEVGREAGQDDLLVLEVNLHSTKRGSPTAIHANVRAYVYYHEAEEARKWEEEKKNPRKTPRSGDLIFWERMALGASSGTGQELVAPLSQGIEQLLKEFFAVYLKAQL